MKMSDVFELPVIVDSDYCIEIGLGQFLIASSDVSDQQSESAAHAINNYDRLVKSLSDIIEARESFKNGFTHAPQMMDGAMNAAERLLAELGES